MHVIVFVSVQLKVASLGLNRWCIMMYWIDFHVSIYFLRHRSALWLVGLIKMQILRISPRWMCIVPLSSIIYYTVPCTKQYPSRIVYILHIPIAKSHTVESNTRRISRGILRNNNRLISQRYEIAISFKPPINMLINVFQKNYVSRKLAFKELSSTKRWWVKINHLKGR